MQRSLIVRHPVSPLSRPDPALRCAGLLTAVLVAIVGAMSPMLAIAQGTAGTVNEGPVDASSADANSAAVPPPKNRPTGADVNSAPEASVLVVCPDHYRQSLGEWVRYRQSQSINVRVIGSSDSAASLTESIRQHARLSDQAILLVGDAPVIGTPADPRRHVPMHYVATTVSSKFGSTPTLATDHPYGDINGDGLTDVAVGRLPVQTDDQLREFIERIKTYENSLNFSAWRRRVQLVGGVGGFGMLADAAIESVTRMIVTASLPMTVQTSVAFGSPGHVFYPRKRFTESITQRYSQGCRFWVYAGHGMVEELDRVPSGPTGVPVLDKTTVGNLQCDPANAPIALLLCCFTGAIDAGVDSFSERLLLHRCGPIVVIAGNRVTMPYGNTILTLGMIDSIYGSSKTVGETTEHRPPATTIGEAFLAAKKRLEAKDDAEKNHFRTLVDSIAMLVSPAGTTLADERREHAALYGLLGDPLLKIHPPRPIEVKTETGFDFGAPIEVTVTSPIDGECTIMLDHPLGQSPKPKPGESPRDPNQVTLASTHANVHAGESSTFTIPVDGAQPGLLAVRVHVAGKETWASGASQTNIRPRPSTK
ncbi:C25 family cysteine peptidase [Roseiconus lacunae]|uniref:C25 family cysteine peptidase n=1 Tax=Roseiconus lacunae TaxID=2605694 RepID=UPI001E629D78|nr:C25 family cysteine peptidase [Roseiconus lacunae]MCD0461921.1 C25 family cysteine peptidase [Roseiconus lacunae]